MTSTSRRVKTNFCIGKGYPYQKVISR
jgi:hypothetical protein